MAKSKRLTAASYDEMVMDTIMRTTIRAPRLHAAAAADDDTNGNKKKTNKSPSPTAKPNRSTARTQQVTPSPASKRSGKKKAAAAAATAAEEADWLAETIAARAPPSPQAAKKSSSPKKAKTAGGGKKSPSKIPHKRGRGAAKAKTTTGTSRKVRFAAEPNTTREKYRRPALLGALAATAATGLYCRATARGWISSRSSQPVPPPAHPLVKTRDQIRKVFRAPTHDVAGGAKVNVNAVDATPAPVVQKFGGAVFDASIAGIVAADAKDRSEEEKGTNQNSKAAASLARGKDKEKLHKLHKKGATHKHRLAQKLDTEARREFWSEVRTEQKEYLSNLRRGVGEKVRGVGGFLKRTVKKDSDALFL